MSAREKYKNPKLHLPLSEINRRSLGAQYIHTNWLYFENTVEKNFNGEDKLRGIVENIYNGVVSIIAKEINFYKSVEKEFLANANRRRLLYFNKNSNLSRSKMLATMNSQYKKQLNDPKTEIGDLDTIKTGALGASRWPGNKNFKMVEKKAMKGRGRPREELEKDLGQAANAVSRVINEEQFYSGLGPYAVQNPDRYLPKSQRGKDRQLKINDKDFLQAAEKRVNSLKKVIKKAEQKRAAGELVKKGSELRHLRTIQNLITDMSLHSFFGRYAEALTPDFINDFLGFFTDGIEKAKNVSETYKQFNVIDTQVITLNVENQDVIVGISQKYKKEVDFRRRYHVYHDIYHVVNAFSGLGIKNQGLEKDSKFLIYLRKNLVTLRQWGLGEPRNIIDYDSFLRYEVSISFLIHFLRFFNGMSALIANGQLSPIENGNPLIFNVFLMTRQGIFYILDLINAVFEVVKNFESVIFGSKDEGKMRFNMPGFSATALIKEPERVDSALLWKRKKLGMEQIKKDKNKKLDYKTLGEEIEDVLEQIGKQSGKFLVEKFEFYMNPPHLLKMSKKSKK